MKQHEEDSRRQNRPHNKAVVQAFGAQRYPAVVTAMDNIKKQLSPSSWDRLRNVLNTELRQNVLLTQPAVRSNP